MKTINLQIQAKKKKSKSKRNKKTTQRHMIHKFLNTYNKEKTLKVVREKSQIICRETQIKMSLSTVSKTVWYWPKLDLQSRTEQKAQKPGQNNAYTVHSSFTKCHGDTRGKGQPFQQTVLGKTDLQRQKNETGPLFYTVTQKKKKNLLKMD